MILLACLLPNHGCAYMMQLKEYLNQNTSFKDVMASQRDLQWLKLVFCSQMSVDIVICASCNKLGAYS